MSYRRYLAVGVTVFLLILVINFPAGYVRGTLQEALPGLQLGNLSGSVFSGQSGSASYAGLDLGTVDWRLQPLALLLLRIEYRLAFSHPDNSGHVTVGVKAGGDVYGKSLDMQLLPDRLLNRFSPVTLVTRGSVEMLVDSFELEGEQLRNVSGTVHWRDGAIESPLVLPLGDLGMVLESREATLAAVVNRGGDMGLSGEILLQPGNRYAVDLALKPAGGLASGTRDLLDATLQRHPAGGYILKTNGTLQ